MAKKRSVLADDELPIPVAEVVKEPVLPDAPVVTPELRHPSGRTISREEIDELREQGFTVDDNHEPVEENAGPVGPLACPYRA